MPKSVNQKQKLLFLLDYLRQNTDETHTVTTPQIRRQSIDARKKPDIFLIYVVDITLNGISEQNCPAWPYVPSSVHG